MHKVYRNSLLSLFFAVLSASTAISQPDSGTLSPSWLQLSFEQRTRYEQLSAPFRTNEPGTERYFPLRTRLKLEIEKSSRRVRFVVEFQDSRIPNSEERIYFPRSQINEHDLLQAHLRFRAGPVSSGGLDSWIQVGRFTMDLGKRRLVARNNMRNTTNAFDGVSWILTGSRRWAMQGFLTRPVSIDPYDWDVTSRRYFWGIYFTSNRDPRFLTDLYYFGIHDMGNSGSEQKLGTIGGRIYRLPKTGAPDYEMESAWQFGKNGRLDHNAYFLHGEAAYTFNSFWKPRISLHYDYASGDKDPEDLRSGQFNTLYGARSFEYPPTSIYGPLYRSNAEAPGIRLTLSPLESLRIVSMYRAIRLAQARDVWVGSGLKDPTGNSGRSVGRNFDTRMQWQANEHLMIEMGYARFFKGSFLRQVSGNPDSGNSNYFYMATEIKANLLPL